MKSLLFLSLFLGFAMVMHGIYEEKYKRLERVKKVEYRFVPRTLYDEQLAVASPDLLLGKFRTMFDSQTDTRVYDPNPK